jgi:hypothetical protein
MLNRMLQRCVALTLTLAASSATAAGENSREQDGLPVHAARLFSRISIGATVGLPLTQAFVLENRDQSAVNPYFGKCRECAAQRTVPYVVGPAMTVRLTPVFSVGVEALYSHAAYNHTSSTFSASGTSILQDTKNVVSRWELPLIVTRNFGRNRFVRPMLGLGLNTQYSRSETKQALVGSHSLFGGTFVGSSNLPLRTDTNVVWGPLATAGLRFGRGRRALMIGIRYIRWLKPAIERGPFESPVDESSLATVRSNNNQAQLLVSFLF